MFSEQIATSTAKFFRNLFYDKDNNNELLDPMTCLIRLCILSFKPQGTKITISDNKIIYNEPNFFQGTVRWSQGVNREDLHNLYNPIIKSLEWYDINNNEIRNIFQMAVKGLVKLKLSYSQNSIIHYTIDHYIEKINSSLTNVVSNNNNINNNILNSSEENNLQINQFRTRNSKKNKNKNKSQNSILNFNQEQQNYHQSQQQNIKPEYEDNNNEQNITNDEQVTKPQELVNTNKNNLTEENFNHIFIKLKELWNKREISIINNLLILMKENDTNESDLVSLTYSIEYILAMKESKVSDILLKTTTILQ